MGEEAEEGEEEEEDEDDQEDDIDDGDADDKRNEEDEEEEEDGSSRKMELRLHSPAGAEPIVYQWPLTSGSGSVSERALSPETQRYMFATSSHFASDNARFLGFGFHPLTTIFTADCMTLELRTVYYFFAYIIIIRYSMQDESLKSFFFSIARPRDVCILINWYHDRLEFIKAPNYYHILA